MTTVLAVAIPCVMVVLFVAYIIRLECLDRRSRFPFASTLRDIHDLPERTP